MLPLTVLNSCPLWHKVDDDCPATKYDDCENDGRKSATAKILRGSGYCSFDNLILVAST